MLTKKLRNLLLKKRDCSRENLRHANVVEFKGICTDQLSLLLEYAYFDFSPFGCDIQTNSLAEFLAVCEQSSCDGMNVAVFTHAAFDIASGLMYLHQNNSLILQSKMLLIKACIET